MMHSRTVLAEGIQYLLFAFRSVQARHGYIIYSNLLDTIKELGEPPHHQVIHQLMGKHGRRCQDESKVSI